MNENTTVATVRTQILQDANAIITRDRQNDYGNPENNFTDIGRMWGILLGRTEPIPPHMVACMMACVKLARVKTSPYKIDNYIDLAGYAACAGECAAMTNYIPDENATYADGKKYSI